MSRGASTPNFSRPWPRRRARGIRDRDWRWKGVTGQRGRRAGAALPGRPAALAACARRAGRGHLGVPQPARDGPGERERLDAAPPRRRARRRASPTSSSPARSSAARVVRADLRRTLSASDGMTKAFLTEPPFGHVEMYAVDHGSRRVDRGRPVPARRLRGGAARAARARPRRARRRGRTCSQRATASCSRAARRTGSRTTARRGRARLGEQSAHPAE